MMFSPVTFIVSLCLVSVTCDDDMEFNWHFPGSNSDSKESHTFDHFLNFPNIYRHNLQQQHLLNHQHQQQPHQLNPYNQATYQLYQNNQGRYPPSNQVNPFESLGQLIAVATGGGNKHSSHETFQNFMDAVKTHAEGDSSEEKGHMVNPFSAGSVQIRGFRKHGSGDPSVRVNGDGKHSDESSEERKGPDADEGSEENGGSSEKHRTRGPSSASTSASGFKTESPFTWSKRPPRTTTTKSKATSTTQTTYAPYSRSTNKFEKTTRPIHTSTPEQLTTRPHTSTPRGGETSRPTMLTVDPLTRSTGKWPPVTTPSVGTLRTVSSSRSTSTRRKTSPITKPTSSPTAAITSPTIPTAAKTSPTIPTAAKTSPTIPTAAKTSPTIPTAAKTSPTIPTAAKTSPTIPTAAKTPPTIPTAAKTSPTLPTWQPTSSTKRSTTTPRSTTPKITTASTRQTTTVSTTEKPIIPDICKNGQVVNGVSYQPHFSDCSKFIQCHFLPDGNVHVVMKSCQHGTYWDQTSMTCNHADAVKCPHDLCRKEGFDRYPSLTNCRGYWICQNGKSEGYCCPVQHSYDVITSGCVPNALCTDECGPVNILNVCDKRAVPGRPLVYEHNVAGKGWIQMPCAQGTAFNAHDCRCSWSEEINQTEILCQPELYIPFNGDIRDESGNNNYLQVDGVKVVDGAGYFDGKSLIRVPRFSNMHFGDTFIVKLRYKEEGGSAGSGQPQALVANGDCNKPSSLYMVAGPGRMDVGLRIGKGQNVSVSVPSNGSGWKDAVLMADNNLLHGTVNGVTYQTLFTGSIEPSKCALQIGRGTDFKPFNGYMDDITVYLCKPKGF